VTIFENASVVMPLCVAATISIMPFSPVAANAAMSCSRTALNGCVAVAGIMLKFRKHPPSHRTVAAAR
jgi:hypothetical protein